VKLRANRPGRETRDIRLTLGLCGMTTLAEVEALYGDFYLASPSDQGLQMAGAILALGRLGRPRLRRRPSSSRELAAVVKAIASNAGCDPVWWSAVGAPP
jgi:hypothetical protein